MGYFLKGSNNDKIGSYGEALIKRTLISRGEVTVIYAPETDGPHPIDSLCLNKHNTPFFAEYKTKPSLNYYPVTGFDKGQWYHYQQLSKILPVYIYFLDSKLGGMYYASVDTLQKNIYVNPKLPVGIKFFKNSCLTLMRKLQPQELSNLKKIEKGI